MTGVQTCALPILDRFEGKKVIRVDINICIKAPEAVLKKCVAAVSK